MKAYTPIEIEACTLVVDTTDLIKLFITDFANHCTRKGCVAVTKESDRFVVTMRLERKKEKK